MRIGFATASACALAVLLVGVQPATAAQRPPGKLDVIRAKAVKRAERVVEQRNAIDVLKVSRCRPRRSARGKLNLGRWRCHWYAAGEFTGRVPYQCSGKARWKRRKRAWRVDPCVNVLPPYAPLRDVPNPHPMFGFNDDWHQRMARATNEDALTVLDRLDDVGADTVRIAVYWNSVEQDRGEFQWTESDLLDVIFEVSGIRPLWVVLGAPCWAQEGTCRGGVAPPAPTHVDEYGRFAAEVASRYPRSAGIEIWNEPNYPRFWGDARPDPDRYGAMLTTAAAQIRQAVPSMPVVSGGLAPYADTDPSAIGYRAYLERLYVLGAAQHADAIGIHPYPLVGPNQDYIGDVRIQLGRIQIEMQKAGDSAPMWATEFGVSTTGPNAFPAEAQGPALAQLYDTFRHTERIDLAIIHRLIDAPHLGGNEAGFGILDDELEPKPAFCSVAQVRGLPC
ncbi:MAG TPA: hypothetical protein VHF58_02335 [Solirubrobacterales bacterium]|nr:hypothetical protein [Solirubrobacterales bacterium]